MSDKSFKTFHNPPPPDRPYEATFTIEPGSDCHIDEVFQGNVKVGMILRSDKPIYISNEKYSMDELIHALEELVKLQAHYATLLNMHDGGARIAFEDAQSWIDRLAELKELEEKGHDRGDQTLIN